MWDVCIFEKVNREWGCWWVDIWSVVVGTCCAVKNLKTSIETNL